MVLIHDRYMVKTPVVYTGIEINEFSNINFTKNTYTMDFYLWFRFKKEFQEAVDIAFLNTSSPLFINSEGGKGKGIVTVLLDKIENNVAIKAYQVNAEFKNDFNFRSFPFDTHKPGIKFRHRTLYKR